jgi:NADH-quinone oxidoreductase subunit F
LIESLEGKRAYPRIKPPYFPAVLGLYMSPTIVNNVETLCHVKHIIEMGGAEYSRLGKAEQHRHAHRLRERRCVAAGLFRDRSRRVTMGQLIYEMAGGLRFGRN